MAQPQPAAQHTFGFKTSANQVAEVYGANIRGKTVLITGANSGLGSETARVLALHGANIILACRSQSNADKAMANIKKSVPDANLSFLELDLSSLKQVKEAAEKFLASGQPLHVLINNAGIMACPKKMTVDGYESQFAVNHLGHFAFTNAVLPALKKSAPSRVVIVSSTAHWVFHQDGGILFDDLNAAKRYSPSGRYGQSKLANILHAKELQNRLNAEGADVRVVALHPGNIPTTNLSNGMGISGTFDMMSFPRVYSAIFVEGMKSIAQGAATQVACAIMPAEDLVKGGYYRDCQAYSGKCLVPEATDEAIAKRLWEVSEQLVAEALAK